MRQVDCGNSFDGTRFSTDNVLTNSKVKIARTVTGRSVHFLFVCLFVFVGESSDGTRAQIACPTAAAGGGVGAERTGSDGATNQSRGEE